MFTPTLILLAILYYIWHNDRLLEQSDPAGKRHPEEVQWTASQVKEAAKRVKRTDAFLLKPEDLPPRTGRRYIIVGGTGFIGSWIVATLLWRGEDPKNIRIVDLQKPSLPEQLAHLAAGVDYVRTDITDRDNTISSFTKSWTSSRAGDKSRGLTVFHCAAVLRYFERHTMFLPRSVAVNVVGTENVIEASKAAGADILIYTSSTIVGVRPTRILSFPWEFERNKMHTQFISDEGEGEGKGSISWRDRLHHDFTSNYHETKFQAELLVRDADKANEGQLRTGILRPGSLIYGPTRQDIFFLALLNRRSSPIWQGSTTQHLLYIENCVAAHLLYEQRLLEAQYGGKDVGGHAYLVVGSPSRIDNLTSALNILSEGKATVFKVSPTIVYFISHLIEGYELMYHHFSVLQKVLPQLKGDLIKIQPSTFCNMVVNLLYDDSLTRAPVEKEGLGYQTKISDLDGVCHTVSWLQENVVNA